MSPRLPGFGSERSRLAAAGAQASVKASLREQPRGDKVMGNLFFALLLLAVGIAFYVVCRFRAARARSRFHLVPSWLEDRRASREQGV